MNFTKYLQSKTLKIILLVIVGAVILLVVLKDGLLI